MGSDTRSFLSVVRSLGRHGVTVHVAWTAQGSPALRSRYVKKVHDIPSPWEKTQDWKSPLRDLLQAEPFDLVIPCNDPSLIPLFDHRSEFEELTRLAIPNEQVYRIGFDKNASTQLAESLGISVPRSWLIEAPEDAETVVEASGLPVILKPLRSYSSDRLHKRNQVVRADTRDQYDRILRTHAGGSPILAQEYFEGVGVGVEFLAHEGRLVKAFQHVRLHEPEKGGGSSHRKSAPLDPELLEATRKLVEALDYSGIGMVEFRKNLRSGKWVFIEINGRFWGSLPLAVACGADFPAFLFDYLVHGRTDFPDSYRVGLRCRNLEKDVGWMRESVRSMLRGRGWGKFLKQSAADMAGLLTLRERSDTFVLDDPAPGFSEVTNLFRTFGSRLMAKAGTLFRSTRPMKAWQGGRMRRQFKRAQKILFVCKGNICRSPFAEHYIRKLVPESVEVASCGYYPASGRPSPEAACNAAKDYGVNLRNHQSREICEEDVKSSDVVFVFDEENRRTLRERFPSARRRIHLLGVMNARGPMHIQDPYGGAVEDFRSCYQIIRNALEFLPIEAPGRSIVSADTQVA